MSVFDHVGALKLPRSKFNLSHSKSFDCSWGNLIPVSTWECVPGDLFICNVAQLQGRINSALKCPMFADVDLCLEAFFVPYRLLQGSDANFEVPAGECNFEDILSGKKDGTFVGSAPVLRENDFPIDPPLPKVKAGALSDYFGLPVGLDLLKSSAIPESSKAGYLINAYPWRAYRWIWDEYYRDEIIQDEIAPYVAINSSAIFDSYDSVLQRCWRKDYFTSALISQQHGTAPALPISGVIPVEFTGFPLSVSTTAKTGNVGFKVAGFTGGPAEQLQLKDKAVGYIKAQSAPALDGTLNSLAIPALSGKTTTVPTGTVNMEQALTFDVSDLRTVVQIQKYLERLERGGFRYTEILRAHYGVSPSDSRLQRPEFLGSVRQPWLVHDVVQTSSPTKETSSSDVSFTGEQSGQAVSLGHGRFFKYHVQEFGLIMIMASVVPRAVYQQGIPAYLTRKTRYDFFLPEFSHLSEQPIPTSRLKADLSGKPATDPVFGFQPIYTELRWLPSMVHNHLRVGATPYDLSYWQLSRYFSDTPVLNGDFIKIDGTTSSDNPLMKVFAVQDENPFVVHVAFDLKAVRPLPVLGEPGYLDHF